MADYRWFEEEFEDGERDDVEDDEWECAFGSECLNPHFIHSRSECYTAEMLDDDLYSRGY